MIETLSVTQILAVFLGLYVVAAGIGLLSDPKAFATVIDDLRENTTLGYVTSVLVFVLGAVIVAVHNLWTDPLAVVVSIFGWGALIEGVLMLAIRRRFLGLVRVIPFTAATMVPFGIFIIVFGAVLLFAGLA
jgi:hypothetical protein